MNQTEQLIAEKAFPKELRMFFYLLCSESDSVKKALLYYDHSFIKSFKQKDHIPCRLEQFIAILQQTIMIPTKSDIIESEVFFVISEKTRQNIIRFLQLKEEEENIEFKNWSKFISENYHRLDEWSKITYNKYVGQNSKESIKTQFLSNSSIERLSKLGKQKFSFFGKKSIHLGSDSNRPSKRRRLNSIPDELLDDDIGNRVLELACAKSEIKYNESKINSQTMVSTTINNVVPCECDTGVNSAKLSEFLIENEATMEALKEKLLSGESFSDYCEELVDLFTKCSSGDLSLICKRIQISKFNEDVLTNIYQHFLQRDLLSFERTKIILYHGITVRISNLNEPVPRKLFTLISEVAGKSHRAAVVAIFSEVVTFTDFKIIHEEFIKRLFTNQIMKQDDIAYILEHSFEHLPFKLSENLLSTIDYLLQQNPEVTKCFLVRLFQMVSEQSDEFSKSLKLMKLLLTILKTYPELVKERIRILYGIVHQNSTFLKKKVLCVLSDLEIE